MASFADIPAYLQQGYMIDEFLLWLKRMPAEDWVKRALARSWSQVLKVRLSAADYQKAGL